MPLSVKGKIKEIDTVNIIHLNFSDKCYDF